MGPDGLAAYEYVGDVARVNTLVVSLCLGIRVDAVSGARCITS